MAAESRWLPGQHPTPEELLLAHEDQLPCEEADAVRVHLHQCWQCRVQAERYQRGIDAYVKFRELHFDPAASPSSGGWTRLAPRLRSEAQTTAPTAAPFWKRIPKPLWVAFPLLATGAALALVFLSPAPLTAKVVLDRALQADEIAAHPAVEHVVVRRAGSVIAEDEFTLRRAAIDPQRPLAVRTFRAWHDALRTYHDFLANSADEIRLETTTGEGAIALARLSLARIDYHPLAKHVELRDGIVIDVDTDAVPGVPPVRKPVESAPDTSAKVSVNPHDREALELEVRWALHTIDADLGDPIEIEAAGNGLIVTGTLDDAARRTQIQSALNAIPNVKLNLTLAATDAGLIANAQPIDTGASAGRPLLASQLQHDIPDVDARNAFVSQTLSTSHAILQRTWALHRLAQRYPEPVEAAMSPASRARLERIVDEHRTALREAAGESAALWKPYFESGAVEPGSISWQAASLANLPPAQTFDHLTARLLAAGADDSLTTNDALRQLREAFQAIRP